MSTPPAKPTPPAPRQRRLMQRLAQYIEAHAEEPLPLRDLATHAQLSPAHLQRCFKAVIGVSPREYQEACRLRRFKAGLRAQRPVTEALYAAGFGSSSRLYERVDSRLGMTPRQYRAGGHALTISHARGRTPLGPLLLAATDRGLCFIQFGEDAAALLAALAAEFPGATLQPMPRAQAPQFRAWMRELNAYLRGRIPAPDLPLDIRGTAFQLSVWKYLQTIPPGQTASYSEVAAALGRPRAVRAVASACARNRIAIAIPCHRVLRGTGALAGYRWGLERKQALLALEQRADAPNAKPPRR